MPITKIQIEKAIEISKKFGARKLILFGSALEKPEEARDLDLACDGIDDWRLLELGAKIENELSVPLDLIPLYPKNRFTRMIEKHGLVLYES